MRRIKAYIVSLLLVALFGIILPLLFAQQDQNTQKPNPEIEVLKKRISELESKLQTVENVEKMELAAKLADANAKLANAEFSKFERELRDSNNKWLWGWTGFFVGVFAVIGIALWLVVKSLIADRVEKNLNGFKEAVDQVNTLKDELRILQTEHAASVLENFMNTYFSGYTYPQSIETLGEETLLQVFSNKKYRLPIREKAVEVLAARKSSQLVSPVLEFLNSIVDSDFDWQTSITGERLPFRFLSFVGQIHTDEAHQGLKKFLNRLLIENPKHKDLCLAWTAFYLADIDIGLELNDSVSIMKKVILDLENLRQAPQILNRLAEYFDRFNEPEGIKEILTHHASDEMPEVETRCLELLQKHDPKFVENWKAQKETANTQNEESE